MQKKEILYLVLIILVSAMLGFLYSIHNTDAHHWGFITSTALDYIQGKKLFTEVYVQYGIGQMVLFKLLHSIFPINFTSIGLITSLVYSLHLLLIFFGVKKISNSKLALLITTTAFFIHTYAIYPWSDYYAGFCLTLACYLMLRKPEEKNFPPYLLAGATLFLCCFFRNTYFFSIAFAGIAYWGVSFFNKEMRNKNIHISLLSFFLLSFSYVFLIFKQGRIHEWYIEGIGTASSGRYHLELTSVLHLLQRAFIPIKITNPNYISLVSIAILLFISLRMVWTVIFKKANSQKLQSICPPGVVFFITSLSLAGLLQALHGYEVFRVQNACGALYFAAGIFLISKFPDFQFQWKNRKLVFGLGFFFLLHLIRFPTASAYFPIVDGAFESYSESKIPYFKWHRFRAEEQSYYENLFQLICNRGDKIVNFTMDSTIPDLCNDESNHRVNNTLSLAFFEVEMVLKINLPAYQKLASGMFELGTMIVSESEAVINHNPEVKLIEIGKVVRPENIRFLKSAPVYVFQVVENDGKN